MSQEQLQKIAAFLEVYQFDSNDAAYIQQAFFHSSYANEANRAIESNERLEYLGDGFINFVIAEYLFVEHDDMNEGDLTKLRAQLVREESLVLYAKAIGLPEMLYLGKGEEQSGGRERPAILGDAFEALLASLYLQYGFERVRDFVYKIALPIIDKQMYEQFTDYKSRLQELVQADQMRNVTYRVISENGPAHNKRFVVEVYVDKIPHGRGKGRSKKSAEQQAARNALALLAQ